MSKQPFVADFLLGAKMVCDVEKLPTRYIADNREVIEHYITHYNLNFKNVKHLQLIFDQYNERFFEGNFKKRLEFKVTMDANKKYYAYVVDSTMYLNLGYIFKCVDEIPKLQNKKIPTFKGIEDKILERFKDKISAFQYFFEHELVHAFINQNCKQCAMKECDSFHNWGGVFDNDSGHSKTFMIVFNRLFRGDNYKYYTSLSNILNTSVKKGQQFIRGDGVRGTILKLFMFGALAQMSNGALTYIPYSGF